MEPSVKGAKSMPTPAGPDPATLGDNPEEVALLPVTGGVEFTPSAGV
jgi:hypothetical protein